MEIHASLNLKSQNLNHSVMKNSLLLFTILVLCFSCVDKNPKIEESKYLAMQQEYEAEKSEISNARADFLSENKVHMSKKLEFFKKIKDSSATSDQVLRDSTFYLADTPIKLINFPISLTQKFVISNTRGLQNSEEENTKSKAIFLAKDGNEFAEAAFNESYRDLHICEDDTEGNLCSELKINELEVFKDLKYAFVIDGYRISEPALEDSKNFTPGLFFASIVVHDIEKNTAILQFNIAASNSEEVQYLSLIHI